MSLKTPISSERDLKIDIWINLSVAEMAYAVQGQSVTINKGLLTTLVLQKART